MGKIAEYILCFVLGAFICFYVTQRVDTIYQVDAVEKFEKRQKKRDSIIAIQSGVIDSLKRTRKTLVVSRDGSRVSAQRTLDTLDSLSTPPVLNDSLINEALLWANGDSL